MTIVRWIASCLVVACLAATPARAGVVRGTLFLSREALRAAAVHAAPVAATASSGGAHAIVPPAPRPERGVTDAVIYLQSVPDDVERRLAGHGRFFARKPRLPRLLQSDMRFVPRVMAVPAGTPVELQNLDRFYHSVFSVSAAHRFDLGLRAPGHIDTVTFDHAGVVNLYCEIHPGMIGYMVVVPNHAFTRPDSLGAFSLPRLPEGRYSLRVWHPRLGERTRSFDMPHHGDVDLDLSF